jgi:hypothetical protein
VGVPIVRLEAKWGTLRPRLRAVQEGFRNAIRTTQEHWVVGLVSLASTGAFAGAVAVGVVRKLHLGTGYVLLIAIPFAVLAMSLAWLYAQSLRPSPAPAPEPRIPVQVPDDLLNGYRESVPEPLRELILIVVDKDSRVGWHHTAPEVDPEFIAKCRIHVNNRLGDVVRLLKVQLVEAGAWGDLWEEGMPSVYFPPDGQGVVQCHFGLSRSAVPVDSAAYTGTVEITDDSNRAHAVSVTFKAMDTYEYDPSRVITTDGYGFDEEPF